MSGSFLPLKRAYYAFKIEGDEKVFGENSRESVVNGIVEYFKKTFKAYPMVRWFWMVEYSGGYFGFQTIFSCKKAYCLSLKRSFELYGVLLELKDFTEKPKAIPFNTIVKKYIEFCINNGVKYYLEDDTGVLMKYEDKLKLQKECQPISVVTKSSKEENLLPKDDHQEKEVQTEKKQVKSTRKKTKKEEIVKDIEKDIKKNETVVGDWNTTIEGTVLDDKNHEKNERMTTAENGEKKDEKQNEDIKRKRDGQSQKKRIPKRTQTNVKTSKEEKEVTTSEEIEIKNTKKNKEKRLEIQWNCNNEEVRLLRQKIFRIKRGEGDDLIILVGRDKQEELIYLLCNYLEKNCCVIASGFLRDEETTEKYRLRIGANGYYQTKWEQLRRDTTVKDVIVVQEEVYQYIPDISEGLDVVLLNKGEAHYLKGIGEYLITQEIDVITNEHVLDVDDQLEKSQSLLESGFGTVPLVIEITNNDIQDQSHLVNLDVIPHNIPKPFSDDVSIIDF
ncbi:hypothetical protein EIN_504460 [Entamoeba invadens IP1]|uniref:Uncharacterized protein n=1 Tax=Entamoeba invadens IP1 TaxID=370355 RepID=A0A0A1UAT0_ENTIV|nr:hypothetical protein EIN_504460 [Entamoeba invadens IP1]ELP90290.1 hypothetical protein EIN_504460 [Entamoeba invadens IP1]|eukprot:XP_004257061.1 hypothetical protein EIN_504460 [Entamoeba invadens IP1]